MDRPITLMKIAEPRKPNAPPAGFALWQLGFRPFYLLASAFAALSIGLWALQFAGWLGTPYLNGPLWHAHEMLFGFTLAVIVGFLLTAGRNWSGRPTLNGAPLAALAALWLAGRVLVLTPWAWAAALVNIAFPLAAAIALAVPFVAAGVRRNYFFVGLLVVLAAAVGSVHLAQLEVIDLSAWVAIQVALDVVLFMMVVMGGRVIPMFTNNGVPCAGAVRHATVEKLALGSVLALLVADLAADPVGLRGAPMGALCLAAAAAHAVRWALWRPWRTLGQPLVWVLHAAYVWIPLHLALRAGAEWGWVASTIASHALAAGAIGGLVIGMMTRTARGHTGRPLQADGFDVACYGLVIAAAVVRVALPLAVPGASVAAVLASALLWSAGFGLYAGRYGPQLCRPRLDGKPG